MRLMRWLAVGCSLGKIREDRSRYKMAEQGLLPRFGPAINNRERPMPGQTQAATGAVPGPRPDSRPQVGLDSGVGVSGANERNSMTTETTAAAVESAEAGAKPEAPSREKIAPVSPEAVGQGQNQDTRGVAAHRFPLGRWTMFRNPFSKSPKPSGAPRGPVQGELWLDLVKPVRNDLTDSDVVVVAGRSTSSASAPLGSSATETSSVSMPEEKAAAEPVWSRLKTQFFGAEKE